MNLRSMSLLAAALLILAACSENPSTSANTGGAANAAPPPAAPTTQGPAPGSKEDFVQNVGDRVFFDFNKSDIKPEGRTTLERQAAWLKKYPNVTVTIVGHCDERGTREYNLGLGARRATAVKNALVALGIPGNRIQTISLGKENPDPPGSNEAAWAQNRRAITAIN